MEMILIESISKQIGGKTVLDHFSLTVEKNRITALLGPSGCGKTTLLRLIAGLDAPDKGKITINGIWANDFRHPLPPRKRQVAMIFQDLALWPHMTVRQHLAYVLRGQRRPKTGRKNQINELLSMVDLAKKGGRYPHQLSGGEQQRLAIIRALAQAPQYLLMDEPFNHLDPILKQELETVILQIQARLKLGIVYVTHNIRDLEKIVDQVAVMQKGRLIQNKAKEIIFSHPFNTFVRQMLQV